MSIVDSAGISAVLMKDFHIDKFLKEYRANLVFHDLGVMGKVPGGSGITVHWHAIADLTVNTTAATEGTDPTAYDLSGGDQTATLIPYNEAIQYSRQAAKTWLKGVNSAPLEKLGRVMSKKIDTVVRDTVFTAGGIVQYGGTAVARNSIATDGSFDLDVTELREAKYSFESWDVLPKEDGFFVCVLGAEGAYDIQGDTNYWRDVVKYTDSVRRIFKGEIGELFGIRFVQTTQALSMDASGSAATDIIQSYLIGEEHFGISELEDVDIVVKDPAPASSVNGYSTVGAYASFATKELKASSMIRLETGASRLD